MVCNRIEPFLVQLGQGQGPGWIELVWNGAHQQETHSSSNIYI